MMMMLVMMIMMVMTTTKRTMTEAATPAVLVIIIYKSLNIIQVIGSRWMRRAKHLALVVNCKIMIR